jgi:hypothetical protein
MTYLWLDDLADALTSQGIPVVEVDGWQDRGRPSSSGQFDPTGLICHHTAGSSSASDQQELNVILSGNSSAPGPISQLMIGREFEGVYVVAAGRANHGGQGLAPWISENDKSDGNAHTVGIEVCNNGIGEYWPDWQTNIYARTVIALNVRYGFPIEHTLNHYEFAQPYYPGSKCDPAGPWQRQPDLDDGCFEMTWPLELWRSFCMEFAGGGVPLPPIPSPGGDEVRYGPWLIQATGADGNPTGRVYATDGNMMTVRAIQNEEALAGYRWTLRQYTSAPELEDGAGILGVDSINAYGTIIER